MNSDGIFWPRREVGIIASTIYWGVLPPGINVLAGGKSNSGFPSSKIVSSSMSASPLDCAKAI